MRALRIRVIVWGWAFSFIAAIGGAPATMEAGIESGSLAQFLLGLILIILFAVFSLALNNKKKACMSYMDQFDKTFIELIKKI